MKKSDSFIKLTLSTKSRLGESAWINGMLITAIYDNPESSTAVVTMCGSVHYVQESSEKILKLIDKISTISMMGPEMGPK